ncbi:heme biosynthesis HemY N-terminal domain-containing protein [Marinicella sp. W31]|uniref:heme biosynthesis HemY N-terminal domain-containing protein n=1 Tax=Marinicella sp. W31 TaxID=3023713 RepID=UPI003756EC02
MKKLTLILIILALATISAWLAPVLSKNPGFVQLEFMGYQIEMSLVAALLLGLAVFVAIWILWSLIKLPGKASKNIKHNSSRKKFASGLLALSEGKWPQAEKLLVKSAAQSPTPELSFMAAARAAMAQNNLEQAEQYLNEAEQCIENPLTVDLTRCELWIKADMADRAIPLLQTILKTYPNNPRAIHLLTQAAQQDNNWAQLQQILPKAAKLKLINPQQQSLLANRSWEEAMNSAQTAEQLENTWAEINKIQKPDLLTHFSENALRVGAFQVLTETIEKQQKQQFSEQLVDYWSRLPHNLNHRIKMAEKWLNNHPDSAPLLTCLGQLYMEKKQWPEAESHLNKALNIAPSAAINQLLGNIYYQQQQPDKALQHYQQANEPTQAIVVIENKDKSE